MNTLNWPGVTRQKRGLLPEVHLDSTSCAASVLEQGAHLLRYRPVQGTDVLWVSPRAVFAVGKAVRGGVPLCFPWFGPHPEHADWPQHGFLRNTPASFGGSRARGDTVELRFARTADAETRKVFPHSFSMEVRFFLADKLAMEVQVSNTDEHAFSYELALHAYFRVSDVETIRVRGLERAAFVDKVRGGAQLDAEGVALALTGEMDRVYASSADVCLEDLGLRRAVTIGKTGSGSTVVWNPGATRGAAMVDVGADVWREFICVEVGNIGDARVTLAPGQSHTTGMTIKASPFG